MSLNKDQFEFKKSTQASNEVVRKIIKGHYKIRRIVKKKKNTKKEK